MPDALAHPDTRFRRTAGCSWSALGSEVLILDMGNRKSHRLTGSGGLIWQRLMAGDSLQQVVDAVTQEYDVQQELAMSDAIELTAKLTKLGVLEQA